MWMQNVCTFALVVEGAHVKNHKVDPSLTYNVDHYFIKTELELVLHVTFL